MKLLRVGEPGEEKPAVLVENGRLLDLTPVTADMNSAFLGADGLERARRAVGEGLLPELNAEGISIGAPLTRPGKVVCVGLNYRDHAAETGAEIPTRPVVFMKDPGMVVGPNDQVLIPRRSVKTDREVELAVVIGRRARYLDGPDAARGVIAGYAVSHDVSEREYQLEYPSQWDIGKSCETFNPLGPWLVTTDEVEDPQNLGLRLAGDGVKRQNGNTRDMIFPVARIVHYLSQYMILEPGDVINTGTPTGVALGLPGTPYLLHGETAELEIDGLGRQRQTFAQA